MTVTWKRVELIIFISSCIHAEAVASVFASVLKVISVVQCAPVSTSAPVLLHKLSPVCETHEYAPWIEPCQTSVPVSSVQTTNNQYADGTDDNLNQIKIKLNESFRLIANLKETYFSTRVRNIHIARAVNGSYVFTHGNISVIDAKGDAQIKNVTLNVAEDYDKFVAAIMYVEQLRFYEEQSAVLPEFQRSLSEIKNKLQNLLCDCGLLLGQNGHHTGTSLTCDVISNSVRTWYSDYERSLLGYMVLRDLGNYFNVMVNKYTCMVANVNGQQIASESC